jgi:hypothetical protein
MRRRTTPCDLILFTAVVAVCLIAVPFLVALERGRDLLLRRKVAMIEPAE